MDLGLKDRVAIVAGASKGLGKAAALGLAAEGTSIVICSRGAETLNLTAEEIRKKTGAPVLAVVGDVTQPDDITRLVEETIAQFKRIDILVNNAGGPRSGTFADMKDDDWQQALTLNLLSTIRLTQAVVPHMRRQGRGRIINITSISVKQPLGGLILSNVARTGVIGFAKSIATELARENILVNNVCPGFTKTERLVELFEARAAREHRTPADIEREVEQQIPMGRLGQPEELAHLIVFLASDRSSYITGTTIQVDGGFIKGLF